MSLRKSIIGLSLAGVLAFGALGSPVVDTGIKVECVSKNSYKFTVRATKSTLGVGEAEVVASIPESNKGKYTYKVVDSKGKKSDGVIVIEDGTNLVLKGAKVGNFRVKVTYNGKGAATYKDKVLKGIKVEVKQAPEYITSSKKSYRIKLGQKVRLPIKLSKDSHSKLYVEVSGKAVKYTGSNWIGSTYVEAVSTGVSTVYFNTYNGKKVSVNILVVK